MRVVLIGGGGQASVVLAAYEDGFEHDPSGHPVIGFLDDAEIDPRRFAGRGVSQLGGIKDAGRVGATHFVLSTGWSSTRASLLARLEGCGLEPAPPVVHPTTAIHTTASIGLGCVVLGGAHVAPLASVGPHSHVGQGALLGHDCEVQDLVTIMPGAVISGDTVLERGCTIGANATVIEGVRIGAGAILGAGAVAPRDVPRGATAVGVPARVRD